MGRCTGRRSHVRCVSAWLIAVSSRVVEAPAAARSILEQSQGAVFDLLALATHGAGGVRRAFLGSVADKLVRGSTHPVLVLKPGMKG